MPFVPLIILLFLVFAALIFALRYVLTHNITSATGHLEEMSKEYAVKQVEINRRLKEVTEEAQKITAKAKQEAEETRNQILKEANAYKEQVVNEARQKSEEIVGQAERTCEVLKNEIHDRIKQQSTEKACALIQNALPDTFRSQLHTMWMEEAEEAEFNLGRLNLPDKVKEVKLASAFPLTEKQKHTLHEKLKKRFGNGVKISHDVDTKLLAGLVVTIDNVVIDGSLKDKVQRQIENKAK